MSSIQFHDSSSNIGYFEENVENLYQVIKECVNHGDYIICLELGSKKIRNVFDYEDTKKTRELLKSFPIFIYTHIPDHFNLCGSSKSLAWSGNLDVDDKTKKMLNQIDAELAIAYDVKSSGTICNAGYYKYKKEKAMITSLKSIEELNLSFMKLLIENSIDQFHAILTSLQDMRKYVDLASFRIDFALHISYFHVNGDYNFKEIKEIDKFFSDYDQLFERNPYVLFIEDTKTEHGSCNFIRCSLTEGNIWTHETLEHLLIICHERKIHIITPYEEDVHLLKKIF